MKNKMTKLIALALVALVCAFAPVVSVLAVVRAPRGVTQCGIYDGGGSGG